jgi:hypothetical protein
MQEQIEQLIKETEQWREYHRQNRNHIDAAACAIRLNALKEVLKIIQNHN